MHRVFLLSENERMSCERVIEATIKGLEIRLNRYDDLYVKAEEKIFDVIEWKDVILNIYQKLSDKKKQELIRLLQRGLNQGFRQKVMKGIL